VTEDTRTWLLWRSLEASTGLGSKEHWWDPFCCAVWSSPWRCTRRSSIQTLPCRLARHVRCLPLLACVSGL